MNTKKTAVVFLCACMTFAFVAGCKKLGPASQQLTTLQGTIFNAITGERIGGTDVRMYLQQGTLTRRPDVFYTGEKPRGLKRIVDNSTIDLMGDYAFANIPSMDNMSIATADVLPNEYRLTVIKDGFQRFEGIIDHDMLANKDNVIRNIYLFPEDFLIPCYTYTAKFNGKPVPGATITVAPYATLNPGIIATDKWLSADLGSTLEEGAYIVSNPTINQYAPLVGNVIDVFTLFNNNYFFPAPGYLASIIEETDAAGQVSLCDKIAAGGAYAVCIDIPEKFEGTQLERECRILIAGYSDTDQIINLDATKDTDNDYGLYVTSISNSLDDQIVDNGTLIIKFNRAVTLGVQPDPLAPFTAGFYADIAPASTTAVWPAAPASRVTATLSADGKTLTLAPAWTTAPALATELGRALVYTDNNGFISVAGYPDSKILLSSLHDANENNISLTVHISTPVTP